MALDLAAIKRHLQIPETDTDPDGDQDLTDKLAEATAIVLDYLKADTLPDSPIVDAAIKLQVGELWRFRGDDPEGDTAPTTPGDLSPTVTNLLRRLRDPALA
jgi:hypothetical protein